MKTEDARSGKALQKAGIEAIVRYVTRRGYDVLERSWKCDAGEADIIAKDGNSLVFVEVLVRKKVVDLGFPKEVVTAKKRDRLERIALAYLQSIDDVDVQVRFDVASLVVFDKGRALIRHHINALGPDC